MILLLKMQCNLNDKIKSKAKIKFNVFKPSKKAKTTHKIKESIIITSKTFAYLFRNIRNIPGHFLFAFSTAEFDFLYNELAFQKKPCSRAKKSQNKIGKTIVATLSKLSFTFKKAQGSSEREEIIDETTDNFKRL